MMMLGWVGALVYLSILSYLTHTGIPLTLVTMAGRQGIFASVPVQVRSRGTCIFIVSMTSHTSLSFFVFWFFARVPDDP